MDKSGFVSGVILALVLVISLAWCISLLPNAIDQSFSIGEYNDCVKCHDGERRCYFQE